MSVCLYLVEGLHFKSKSILPVVACILKPISMYCCMSNFSQIQWFRRDNDVWLKLEESYAYNMFVLPSYTTVYLLCMKCVSYYLRQVNEVNSGDYAFIRCACVRVCVCRCATGV